MAKDPNNYDPYERKRDIKQLEKSYLVLRERREMNPNHTRRMWFYCNNTGKKNDFQLRSRFILILIKMAQKNTAIVDTIY